MFCAGIAACLDLRENSGISMLLRRNEVYGEQRQIQS